MRLLLALLFGTCAWSQQAGAGAEACAGCHAEIVRKYLTTGMARSSGRVGSGSFREKPPAGPIRESPSGPAYAVTLAPDSYHMSFEHPASGVRGVRDLKWFIGSGNVGRSYLFPVDGFLFQAPVSYYSAVERWGLSPGYAGKGQIELSKPIEEPCLYCHASQAQPVANTANRYGEPPFLGGGIGCERCHGATEKHLRTQRDIVNPVKLAPARRDSICQQCHLTGAARVPRRGHSVGTYRPGDLLSDHLAVFVWDEAKQTRTATDHSEQLARSQCKLASGDALWCGTCHDPHAEPAGADYRKTCLGCHARKGCSLSAKARAAADDNCAACHMPKAASGEGAHVAFTDHTIVRRPASRRPEAAKRTLRSFWRTPVNERDLAIATASLGGNALPLLERLRALEDAPVLTQLGQLYDAAGKPDLAEAVYERALRIDPGNAAAGANLAIYRARKGRVQEALTLWRDVFSRNPAMAAVGINLAIAETNAGDRVAARQTLERLLRFHPDLEAARQLLAKLP